VRYAASGTQQTKPFKRVTATAIFDAVSVETEKSDEVLAEQVRNSPQTGPNGNASCAKSGADMMTK